MIKSENYNNLSEDMIPTLGRNEVAVFRSVHNGVDPSGIGIFPTYFVPNKDVIWDEGKQKYVDIAFITQPTVKDKKEQLGTITFETSQKGTIVLRGTSPQDVLMYQYLKLCNYNVSNQNRNPDTFSIFEEVNEEAKISGTLQMAKRDAEIANYALTTPIEQLKAELKNRNVNVGSASEEKIRAMAIEEGKKNPFSKVALPKKVDSVDSKSLIMEGIEAGLISYDSKEGAFKDVKGNKLFEIYKSVQNKEDKFADALDADDDLKEKVKTLFK
jgi:hypothetical protein